MTKKQKSKYAGALLPPPQPSLFDNLEKGDELSNYDKEIFYDSMFHWKWVMDSFSLSLVTQRALTNDNLYYIILTNDNLLWLVIYHLLISAHQESAHPKQLLQGCK